MRTAAIREAGPLTEKFSASAGRWLGVAAAAMGVVLLGGAALDEPAENWRIGSFGLALILLSWAVLVRPSVSAHENGLLLRNVLRDSFVPWGSVERCKALQTFQVATPYGVVHGLGISRSARSMMRQQVGGNSVIGTLFSSPSQSAPATSKAKEEVQSSASYVDFVESRIMNLAEGSSVPAGPVVRSPALWPIVALVSAVAFVVLPLAV